MKDSTFMDIAKTIANESKCVSIGVGAVIVKDDRIISTGYNGTPSGSPNCCDVVGNSITREQHHEWSKSNEIHAELNAIIFAAKNGIAINGSTMYCTHNPCPDCAKAITQSGIVKVIYKEKWHRTAEGWDDILLKNKIKVEKIEDLK